jgi:mRNA interferase MazF
MRRGDVWWVRFGPPVGGEIRKERPAIIVSNDSSNEHLNRVQVVPITSSVGRLYPSEALVSLNGEPRKALADQLTTVSKLRLVNREGSLSASDLQQVERAIRIQLGLPQPDAPAPTEEQ